MRHLNSSYLGSSLSSHRQSYIITLSGKDGLVQLVTDDKMYFFHRDRQSWVGYLSNSSLGVGEVV